MGAAGHLRTRGAQQFTTAALQPAGRAVERAVGARVPGEADRMDSEATLLELPDQGPVPRLHDDRRAVDRAHIGSLLPARLPVDLDVSTNSPEAQRLYESVGFLVWGRDRMAPGTKVAATTSST